MLSPLMVFVVSVLVANPLASQKFLVKQSTTCVYMQNMWKKGYVETRKKFFFPLPNLNPHFQV